MKAPRVEHCGLRVANFIIRTSTVHCGDTAVCGRRYTLVATSLSQPRTFAVVGVYGTFVADLLAAGLLGLVAIGRCDVATSSPGSHTSSFHFHGKSVCLAVTHRGRET